MIGFYLALQNDLKRDVELLCRPFSSFGEADEISANSLHLFSDNGAPVLSSDDYTFYVIGTLVYKNQWNIDALKLISRDLSSGMELEEIALSARGQYCLVIYTRDDVFVVTDKLGSFPIYLYEGNGIIQVSNIFPLLAERNSVTLNFQALAEFISSNTAFCFGHTLFKEINYLHGGTIYRFGNGYSSRRYYNLLDNIEFNKHRRLSEVSGMARDILTENLSFLKSQDVVFVDLTGGFDTRTVAVILNSIGVEFTAGICGEQVPGESQLGKEVARILGVEYRDDFRIQNRQQFMDSVSKHYSISNGIPLLYHSSELVSYYDIIKRDYRIHVTGFSGTQFLSLGLKLRDTIKRGSIDVDKFLRGRFGYADIINDSYMTESTFYSNLRERYEEIIKVVEDDAPHELLALLVFLTQKYYHGSLIGIHNCILPFYSPYFEANFAEALLQVTSRLKYAHEIQTEILSELNPEAASMMTTHGYTASRDSRTLAMSLRVRLKRLAKQLRDKSFLLAKGMNYLGRYWRKGIGVLPDTDRQFWVQEVQNSYSGDMLIFDGLVDKVKFENALSNHSRKNEFMSKIVYLNRIIEKYEPEC